MNLNPKKKDPENERMPEQKEQLLVFIEKVMRLLKEEIRNIDIGDILETAWKKQEHLVKDEISCEDFSNLITQITRQWKLSLHLFFPQVKWALMNKEQRSKSIIKAQVVDKDSYCRWMIAPLTGGFLVNFDARLFIVLLDTIVDFQSVKHVIEIAQELLEQQGKELPKRFSR